MRKLLYLLSMLVLLLFSSPVNALPDWEFELINSSISGEAGSTIGWGYSISNHDSTYWLSIEGLNADPFLYSSPLSLFDYPILSPGETRTLFYDGSGSGIYELTWDTNAPVGFSNTGAFILNASWYDGDPLGSGMFIESAPDKMALYEAAVTDNPVIPVPEPSSLLLLAYGLGFITIAAVAKRQII